MTRRTLEQRIAALEADHRSGASALARQAVEILAAAHRIDTAAVEAAARGLCEAQPAMASVWTAAAVSLRDDGPAALAVLSARMARAPSAVSRVLLGLFSSWPANSVRRPLSIATVSSSGTVRACLDRLASRGRLTVVCAEGRPMLEGRDLAVSLAESGVGAVSCTDAAVGELVETADPPIDAVLVGADAVAPSWFLNKCGTRTAAAAAGSAGVPCYVVAARHTFIGSSLSAMLAQRPGPPSEVWDSAPQRVRVANPYFERLSLEPVTLFVTDVGALGAGAVPDVCEAALGGRDAERLLRLLRSVK